MILTGFLIVFIFVTTYLLLVPIVLFIDTNTNQYFIQLKGLAKASVELQKTEVLRIKLSFLFMNFYFFPLKYIWIKKKKAVTKQLKRKRFGFKNGMQILKTFKVKKLLLNVDTGNCILNAKLYPLFYFLNYYVGCFSINFEGKNRLALHLENRSINIIKSIINLKTKHYGITF